MSASALDVLETLLKPSPALASAIGGCTVNVTIQAMTITVCPPAGTVPPPTRELGCPPL